jgi:hypothetical protein
VAVGFHDARNDTGVIGSGGRTPYPTTIGILRHLQHRRRGDLGGEHALERRVLERGRGGQRRGLWRLRYRGRARKSSTVWADNWNRDGTNPNGTLHAFDLS